MIKFDENNNYTLEGLGAVYKFTGYTFEPTDSGKYASVQLDVNGYVKSFFNEDSRPSRPGNKFLNKQMEEIKRYKVAYRLGSKWQFSDSEYLSVEEFIKNNSVTSDTVAYLLKD